MHGSRTIISESTPVAGYVDTGSPGVFPLYACRDTYLFSCPTVILMSDNLFQLYKDAIPEATFNEDIGLLEISSDKHMQPLHFRFGDHDFTLDVDEQLVPEEMNKVYGGDAGTRYILVGPIGVTGDGLDFVLGIPFLAKYYTVSSGSCFEKDILNGHPWQVYDADNQQIGFAQAYVLA